MRARTYYQSSMVDPEADPDIISVVHRRLAQRFHPDVDPARKRAPACSRSTRPGTRSRTPRSASGTTPSSPSAATAAETDRFVKRAAPVPEPDPITGRPPWGEAGPPPAGPRKGPVLDFGRYRGWTLDQIARQDRDFLEWLQRHPAGRLYRVELEQLLGRPSR